MEKYRPQSYSWWRAFVAFCVFTLTVSQISAKLMAQDQQTKIAATNPESETSSTANAKLGSSPTDASVRLHPDTAQRLGSGDLIEVNVFNVPDLSTKARISSDGNIYIPLVDYVHVGGLTVEEAQTLIQKRLSDGGFVKEPHVSLFVDSYASDGASVLGEVTKPGVYPVLGQPHLLDLISAAGGLTEKAGQSVTVTHRSQPDKPITVALGQNMTADAATNVPVFPGDTIIVRKADVVYVVGDVGRPSGFSMGAGHLTVLQAIALAGGTTRTAKLSAARIIRKTPEGMTETPVELKKILEAKAPDMPMQPDDILFIPTSAGKALAGRTLEAAVQAASAASIIAVFP